MRTLRILLLSLALLAAAPGDFAPYLVKDINPEATPESANPDGFVTLGDLVLFRVYKLGHGELWRTDGTASGTYRLAEIGAESELVAVTGRLVFFRYRDLDDRRPLWVTDGTLPGTLALGETVEVSWHPWQAWVPEQGLLYFISASYELWRTDGTPGGTYAVTDMQFFLDDMTSFQGRVYLAGSDGLWRSDGTPEGTVLVHEVWADSLHAVGPRLIFLGWDPDHDEELWASDGTTAGTRLIADLLKGGHSPEYSQFKVVGQRLYFSAFLKPRGEELYVTDGTVRGTVKITSFFTQCPFIRILQALNGRLLFTADDRTRGSELWSTDGTPAGTRLVVDACPGECSSVSTSFHFRHQGRLYYEGTDGTHGSELWTTDGTARGTRMVKDVCPGKCSSSPWLLSAVGERLFFGTAESRQSSSLWTTDGTEEGTVLVTRLPDSFGPGAPAGGVLLFSAADPDHGRELWCSDGTAGGTHLLVDVADEDGGGSYPRSLMSLGGSVLFLADDVQGPGLWRSDGTATGTGLVTRNVFDRGAWTASANRVFFEAGEQEDAFELWTSDGSEAGTLRLTPEGVRSRGEISAPVAKLGSRVFFGARSREQGVEPWVTDGTRAGTRLLADLLPGPDSSSPHDFMVFQGRAWFATRSRLWRSDGTAKGTAALGPRLEEIRPWTTYGGRLWFTGRNSRGNTELWSTDGAAGTGRIAELDVTSDPVIHGGRLWFRTDGGDIWSTDGTAAGLRQLELPDRRSGAEEILSDGVRLYLSLWREVDSYHTVYELWVSDGTAAGSHRISDRIPSNVRAAFAGGLYFVASGTLYRTDGTEVGTQPVRSDGEPDHVTRLFRFGNGLIAFTLDGEVWQTDGTAGGTKLVRDLSPGQYDSSQAAKAGSRLFFPAFDPETGWELWALQE